MPPPLYDAMNDLGAWFAQIFWPLIGLLFGLLMPIFIQARAWREGNRSPISRKTRILFFVGGCAFGLLFAIPSWTALAWKSMA